MAHENMIEIYIQEADAARQYAPGLLPALLALVYVQRSVDQHLEELVELERERLTIATKEAVGPALTEEAIAAIARRVKEELDAADNT